MTILNHVLGFPRIGLNRELKKVQESYWSGNITEDQLLSVGKNLRKNNWKLQKESGIDVLPVGDFAWYDHVLSTSMLLGNIPERHKNLNNSTNNLDTLFRIARGKAPTGKSVTASEMTKWFNTNYHYIVPELLKNQEFSFSWPQLLEEVDEALLLGYKIKPILLGPLTYLWLGKIKGDFFDRLSLLKKIIPIYQQVLIKLKEKGISWVQIDEPILVLDLQENWKKSFDFTYSKLVGINNLLLTTYFGSINHNLDWIRKLPVQGLHVDLVSEKLNLNILNQEIPKDWLLSLGVINGRNIWKSDLLYWFKCIQSILKSRENIWIGSSCSLLHVPIDLNEELLLNEEIKGWFSFAVQKCDELKLLKKSLNENDITEVKNYSQSFYVRLNSKKIHNLKVQKKLQKINKKELKRHSAYSIRSKIQQSKLNLPILPLTTIGSFPQTLEIRELRVKYKNNYLNTSDYFKKISKYIEKIIRKQEMLGLDVLVHGEFERSDMVEYFGQYLNGFVFTSNGWVQSYGSRCVKPPIIIGDISRSKPITIDWIKYAQSLTKKPVKGMITGPVTILKWSFSREDISDEIVAKQIALALRDEVFDLEKLGIKIIQIDEPALREGLPLRRSFWKQYLSWSVEAFRMCSSIVKDETQIHTHMCYCEFNDIMHAISELDADVITIETSRSDMELLEFFKNFQYPNGIGPGVYDIHSPNIPTITWMMNLLKKAIAYIPVEQLWVNPDCGLKTRTWKETEEALKNMVIAAKNVRLQLNRK